eukprot:135187-Prymnesium_polylepis.2
MQIAAPRPHLISSSRRVFRPRACFWMRIAAASSAAAFRAASRSAFFCSIRQKTRRASMPRAAASMRIAA